MFSKILLLGCIECVHVNSCGGVVYYIYSGCVGSAVGVRMLTTITSTLRIKL
jgi:hypothetical protein